MATLYEIDERLRLLYEEAIDGETGEIIQTEEEFDELLNKLQMELGTKLNETIVSIR